MGKTAFIFPGQGAQKAGMGKDFYEKYDTAKDVFDSAGKWLDLDMKAKFLHIQIKFLTCLVKYVSCNLTVFIKVGSHAGFLSALSRINKCNLTHRIPVLRLMHLSLLPVSGSDLYMTFFLLPCRQSVLPLRFRSLHHPLRLLF